MADFGATWFDRFWNSTIGLPQQVGYRLLRVAQGDADLLSERGLLDKSLVPLLGIADDHTKDVGLDEMTQRFNRVLGGKGIGEGWVQNLAVGVLTDPTTFATSGLTAAGKLGSLLGKASSVLPQGIKAIKPGMTMLEAIPAIREAVMAGNVPGKFLDRALMRLSKAEELVAAQGFGQKTWAEITKEAGKRELMLAMPFGILNNQASLVVSRNHQSWFSLVGQPLKDGGIANRAFSLGFNGVASRNIPFLSSSFRQVGGLVEGMGFGFAGKTRLALSATTEEAAKLTEARGGIDRVMELTDAQRTLDNRLLARDKRFKGLSGDDRVAKWQSMIAKHQKEGRSPEDSFRILLTSVRKSEGGGFEKVWAELRESVGLPKADLTWENLGRFADEFDSARVSDSALADQLMVEPVLSKEFEATKFRGTEGFRLGEKFGRGLARRFISPAHLGLWRDYAKERQQLSRTFNASQSALARSFYTATQETAKELGMEHGALLKSLSVTSQIVPQRDEFEWLGRLVNGIDDPTEISRFLNLNAPNFQRRLADATLLNGVDGPLAVGLRRGLQLSGFTDETLKQVRAGSTIDRIDQNLRGLNEWLDEARTVFKDEGKLPSAPDGLLDDLSDAYGSLHDEVMEGVLGSLPAGSKAKERMGAYWEALQAYQSQHLGMMRDLDLVGMSVPLAQVPRVITAAEASRISKILEPTGKPALDSVLGELRGAHFRIMDTVTVETVNRVVGKLRALHNQPGRPDGLGEILDQLMASTPELAYRYSETPHVALAVSLGRAREIKDAAGAVDHVLKQRLAGGQQVFMGGELLATGEGTRVRQATQAFRRSKAGEEIALKMARAHVNAPERWIAFKDQATGAVRVTWTSMGDGTGQSLFLAGKGKSVGQAAGRQIATGGKLSRIGYDTTLEVLDDALGKQVLVGPAGLLDNVVTNFGYVQEATPGWLRGYDTIHSMLKAGATIVRPDFALFNLMSSMPMLHMNGASYRSILGGMRDALTFLSRDHGFTSKAERMGLLEGDQAGFFGRVSRKAGVLNVNDAVERARLAGGDVDAAVFEGGLKTWYSAAGVAETPADTYRAWGEGDMFGGLTTDVLGSGRESQDLADLAKTKKGAARAGEVTREILHRVGQNPEALARVAGYFSYRRMGYSAEQAVSATTKALFNYNDITPFEQRIMKRAFSFYTFPRKMVPASLRYIGRKPGEYAATVKTLYNLPGSESEMGALAFRPEGLSSKLKDYRVNLQRALPQLDVISHGSWLADFFLDWRAVQGAPERKSGGRLAIPLEAIRPFFDFTREGPISNNAGRILQEAFRTSYMTRWAVSDTNDPLRTQGTIFDGIVSNVFGVRRSEKVVRQRWLVNQYQMISRELEERAGQEEDSGERALLIREIQRLALTTGRLLKQ